MRRKLKQFPEVVKADIDPKTQRATMEALPSFDQYVALEHALEEGGGAIQMFHPRYIVPRAVYASLGVKDRDVDKLDGLRKELKGVAGVRSVVVDDDRWFTNEQGLDVGGTVLFADARPGLDLDLSEAAKRAGFIWEGKDHGSEGSFDMQWSMITHGFAGVCLLFLSLFALLQLVMKDPPPVVRYGTVWVWGALFLFLFVCADRGSWPLGPISWFDAFKEWDTVQHRMGIGILLLIAIGDYLRIKRGLRVNPVLSRWGVLTIGLAGSAMLFTHLHSTLDPAHYAMVVRMNLQHIAMATAALAFSLSKFAWDSWRFPRAWGQFLPIGCLAALGVILVMYVE